MRRKFINRIPLNSLLNKCSVRLIIKEILNYHNSWTIELKFRKHPNQILIIAYIWVQNQHKRWVKRKLWNIWDNMMRFIDRKHFYNFIRRKWSKKVLISLEIKIPKREKILTGRLIYRICHQLKIWLNLWDRKEGWIASLVKGIFKIHLFDFF